jgi:hypothetical protein
MLNGTRFGWWEAVLQDRPAVPFLKEFPETRGFRGSHEPAPVLDMLMQIGRREMLVW